MVTAVQAAIRVAVRAATERIAAGEWPSAGDVQVKLLVEELHSAGCWSGTQRSRIDGLRGDPVLADLVRRLGTDLPMTATLHRILQYLESAVSPPVAPAYLRRIDIGLELLAELIDETDDGAAP